MRWLMMVLGGSLYVGGAACSRETTNAGTGDAGISFTPTTELSDGSIGDLPGGLVPLTAAQLGALGTGACVQPLRLDGGVELLATLDGGACAYPILWPDVVVEIPDGCTSVPATDPSKLSVVWVRDADQPFLIGPSAPDCAHTDGWYPSSGWESITGNSVVLCPATCAAVNADTKGHIDIYAGCSGPAIIC